MDVTNLVAVEYFHNKNNWHLEWTSLVITYHTRRYLMFRGL